MSVWVQVFTACPGVWKARAYDRFGPSRYQKSDPSEFKEWWAQQPDSVKKIIHPYKTDARWAKIQHLFNTVVRDSQGTILERKPFEQQYVICIDAESEYAGNFYNDDSLRVIYLKFFLSACIRPFHLIAKTIYFLSLAAFIKAIVNGVKKKEKGKALALRLIRPIVDIVRTPLYGLVLMVVAIGALIISSFKPTLLYDCRALTGRLLHELYWSRRPALGSDLTPCMRRLGNLMDYEKNLQWAKNPRLEYPNPENPLLVALENRGFNALQRE